ncbi:MAG TPA: hypothetical protein DHV67_02160 [Gallionella sp.]|nr:MAG: hypothetical protein COZ77_07730 [Gallionellales bacterium CG_4_8_14_3_um_filter_54_18]HCJ50644.1 hypothetical protein [Gallionella sp.]
MKPEDIQTGEWQMNVRVETFIEQARCMTQEERVSVLDALQELVVPPNPAWQERWALEASDRIAAYERGEIEAEDFDPVMERLRVAFLDK